MAILFYGHMFEEWLFSVFPVHVLQIQKKNSWVYITDNDFLYTFLSMCSCERSFSAEETSLATVIKSKHVK